jgi:hypothetical protein
MSRKARATTIPKIVKEPVGSCLFVGTVIFIESRPASGSKALSQRSLHTCMKKRTDNSLNAENCNADHSELQQGLVRSLLRL